MSYHKSLDYSDLHAPSSQQVENAEAFTIAKAKVVRLSGFGVQFPTVLIGNSSLYASFGIVQSDILAGQKGVITCIGLIRGLDTSLWTVGSPLYCDSSGDLTLVASGAVIAIVVKQNVTDGILYAVASVDLAICGAANAWNRSGNIGTNPTSNFIGTTDAQPLAIRANSLEVARFTETGRFGLGVISPVLQFEQKTHASANATGLQQETFYVETNSAIAQTCYSFTVADPSVYHVEFNAIGRKADGTERASFKRSMLVFRESSSVQLQGAGWQSDLTIKSINGFNVSYVLGASTVTLQVKAPTSDNCKWTGSVRLHAVL